MKSCDEARGRRLSCPRRALAVLTLATLLASAAAREPDEGYERGRAEARTALVADLAELGEWCAAKKLLASGAELWRLVLARDPEHEGARKALGYKRAKDGSWRAGTAQRPAKDADDGAARAELELRRAGVIERFRERLLALLASEGARLTRDERADALAAILELAPDDEPTHALLGEVRSEASWVLAETVAAKQRRGELKQLVRRELERAPEPQLRAPSERERAFGIAWRGPAVTARVRVLGTGDEAELLRAARALHATPDVFEGALGASAKLAPSYTAFALAQPGDKQAFLDAHPLVSAAPGYREFLDQLEGSGIQGGGDVANWAGDERRRLDALVRHALSWLFVDAFAITTSDGWVHEGFGLYLTRELVGTRLTWFVQPSRYLRREEENALRARLYAPETNWMSEAHALLSGERAVPLASLVGKTVNDLTPEDLLLAYVLASYLLEARASALPELLRRLGAGEALASVCPATLGLELDQLDQRVQRWLSERR